MIDWFTVFAQIINFLILVALLRYFLYGRVIAAMDKRQQEITAAWNEAQQQRVAATKEVDVAREKNRQLDDQREQLLANVHDEVEQHRQQLTAKVRAEVDELHQRWSDAIQEEIDSFLRDLRRRASEEVCAIARRALADLASVSLEQLIVEQFLSKIEQLDDHARQKVNATQQEDNRVVIQTTYQLAGDLREAVTKTIQKQFPGKLDLQFELSTDLLCGIAMQTNGHQLAWNLRDYLISLEQELRQTLEEETVAKRPRQKNKAGME